LEATRNLSEKMTKLEGIQELPARFASQEIYHKIPEVEAKSFDGFQEAPDATLLLVVIC
jgi:hypothetical protein